MTLELLTPRRMQQASLLVLAALVVAGWWWRGPGFAGGVLVGGGLAVLNFHVMARILLGTLGRRWRDEVEARVAGRQAAVWMTCRYVLRFVILALILFLLIRNNWVDVFGLLLGLSTVVLTLLIVGIIEVRKNFFKEALAVNGTSDTLS